MRHDVFADDNQTVRQKLRFPESPKRTIPASLMSQDQTFAGRRLADIAALTTDVRTRPSADVEAV